MRKNKKEDKGKSIKLPLKSPANKGKSASDMNKKLPTSRMAQ